MFVCGRIESTVLPLSCLLVFRRLLTTLPNTRFPNLRTVFGGNLGDFHVKMNYFGEPESLWRAIISCKYLD